MTHPEKLRYFVDERIGCIAVRDAQQTNPDDRGLHSDTEGVVDYWEGHTINTTCPTCGQTRHGDHVIRDEDRVAAHRLCEEMNADSSNARHEGETK